MSATDNHPTDGDPPFVTEEVTPGSPAWPAGSASRADELDLTDHLAAEIASTSVSTGSPAADADRFRHVGERSHPANRGELGFTYTIYRYYDIGDRLLFLGRSERVRQRIVDDEVGHPRGLPLGHDDGPKPWWREAARIELEHLPPGTTAAEARAEERRQIEAFRPAYNREFNEETYDRSRVERAIDAAHFEVDVATAEHERHDGVIRPVEQIVVETERTAERLRPAGAARLHYGLRRPPGEPSPAAVPAGVANSARRRSRSGSFDGPGSIGGLLVVVAILIGLVLAAIVVSLRVVL